MLRRKLIATIAVALPLAAAASQVSLQLTGSLLQGRLEEPIASAQNRPLVMGLIPAENNEEMVRKFEPMRAYLEKKVGRPVKVFTATDYAGVIRPPAKV